jgi:hypothetical protein
MILAIIRRNEALLFRAFEDHILDEATCTQHRSIIIPSALTKCTHLEDKSSTLGLLVTTVEDVVSETVPVCAAQDRSCGKCKGMTYPSSKCLQRLSASCALVLHEVHSNLRTTFLVVLAFLWNTGLV